jgi:nitrate/TMAO reductase-like tetraheme cytochrome c subunit
MLKLPQSLSPAIARLAHYARNPLTILGFGLTTLAGLSLVVFLVLEIAGQVDNPYTGVFGSGLLPLLFVAGLLLMPVGILRRRRAYLRSGQPPEALANFPKLDFNDPHLRRVVLAVASLTVINVVVLATSTVVGMNYMDTPKFCGTVCHKVMRPEYTAYQNSPHSRVKCVQCHIGPGASWAVRSKFDGLRQVWKVMTGTYAHPIPSPVHTLRPARDTCESCHWPAKHYGDKLQVVGRFADDEKNSASFTALLLRTGGGAFGAGQPHGGIHWWHIYADNRIRYVASDPRRQEIAWVELTTPDGTRTEFVREGAKLPLADSIQKSARVMDCIDCHNRPTHLFETPAKAMDSVLQRQPDLRSLPFLKREATKAITAAYSAHDEGVASVRRAVADFYGRSFPDIAQREAGRVERAADAAAGVYDRTVFPEMNTNSKTHPNNIGHDDSPGCFRCHDGNMKATKGELVIPNDCDTCHAILVDGSPHEPDLDKLILPAPAASATAPSEARP